MGENILSSRQSGFLLFLLLLGSAALYLPEISAGRDAWISSVLASIIGGYVLYVIIYVQSLFPGVSIIEISTLALGRIAGTIMNSFFILLLFMLTVLYLYDLGLFLKLILPDRELVRIYGVIILAAAYILYKGINSLGRLADLFAIPVFVLTVFGFVILVISCADFTFLTPVLTDWKPVAGAAIYGANWPYANIVVLSAYLFAVKDLGQRRSSLYKWFLLAVVVLALRSLVIITAFGQELTMINRFPLLESLRIVAFSQFQRIELFFFLAWFITGFFAVAICYQGLVVSLEKMLHMNPRLLILPAGLLVVTFTAYTFTSDIQFMALDVAAEPFLLLPVQLLYPTIIFVAAKCYCYKIKNNLKI